MKKILLVLAVFGLLVSSCQKDGDTVTPTIGPAVETLTFEEDLSMLLNYKNSPSANKTDVDFFLKMLTRYKQYRDQGLITQERYDRVAELINGLINSFPGLDQRPNIVIIMTDDQGFGDAGYLGHDILKTPNIDKLASQGAVINRFYAPAPSCAPSRASHMIGRHHERTGILSHKEGQLNYQETTLAEMLKEVGYTTAHFGKWHLGKVQPGHERYGPPIDHGYDKQFVSAGITDPYYDNNGLVADPHPWLVGSDSEILTTGAIDFIQQNQEEPFFITLWFSAPHTPLELVDRFAKDYSGLPERVQSYYSMLADMDYEVGRLNDRLIELGLEEDTMILFSSDNGPAPSPTGGTYSPDHWPGSNAGLNDRKGSLLEGGIRVPGFIKWPNRIASSTVHVPMSTTDYFQTLAYIVGVDVSKYAVDYDGENMWHQLVGKRSDRVKDIFFRYSKEPYEVRQRALIRNDFKIYSADGESYQLYNLKEDPFETTDLSSVNPELLESMVSAWEEKSNALP